MKKINILLASILFAGVSFGQTVAVQGMVVDGAGKPVPFAFVRDAQHSYATYSDPDGSYMLRADPASKLVVTAKGYGEATAAIKEGGVNVTLPAGDGAVATTNSGNIFSVHSDAGTSTVMGSFQATTEVQGNRYLSEGWMHGFAINTEGAVVQNPAMLFNYDMMGGDIISTTDEKSVTKVARASIMEISLFDSKGKAYTLAFVPAIDPSHYVQVLANGAKYKIYKQIIIRYMKANYQTNGMTSTGNKFDSYEPTYFYFMANGSNAPVKFNPKKKVLKELFAADAEKLNKYMSSASGDIDDAYLKGLGDALN
ncbi:hypothetical protein A0256_06310 [Mucilaginibacter sp. PAMC 26640]|nr:hypothetical protein A0256_06310 [Mucilaginibacter sp. PAMC 26640]